MRVAGSIPAETAIWSPLLMARKPDFHSGNAEFDSRGDHHTALSSKGRIPDSDSGGVSSILARAATYSISSTDRASVF